MKSKMQVRLLFAPVFAIVMLLLGMEQASSQTAPPMMVQVPFVSVAAGGITSGGTVSGFVPSSCTTSIPTTGGNNYGDGCAPNLIGISAGSSMGPYGVAIDKWGNIYFGQNDNSSYGEVRVIYAGDPATGPPNPATALIEASNLNVPAAGPTKGAVYTVAGGYTGTLGSSAPYYCNKSGSGVQALTANGSGCPGTQSYIKRAYGVAVDTEGNVFVVDSSNSVVYVAIANATGKAASLVATEYNGSSPAVTPQIGYLYRIASSSSTYSDGVLAINAGMKPYGVAVDNQENVYIADNSGAVREINGPNTTTGSYGPGFIHTIAGNCGSSSCTALAAVPATNAPALGAAFVAPMGIVVDNFQNVYVGDNSSGASAPSTVRVIYAGGAGNPLANLICIESSIPSCSAPSLQSNYVYTIAGNGNAGATAQGNGALATSSAVKFYKIQGLALDAKGNVYIADYGSHGVIAEVNATTGLLTFIAGDAAGTMAKGNNCVTGATGGPTMTDAYGDGCPATESSPYHIEGNPAFDSQGNLYFTDNVISGATNALIRKLTFSTFPSNNVGNSATQNFAFSLLTGATTYPASNVAVSVLERGNPNSDFADGGGSGDSCNGATILNGFTTASNGTTSSSTSITTCVVPITFTPTKVGARSGAVQISATVNGGTIVMTPAYLTGIGAGADLVIDPAAATTIGSGTTPQGVAVDGSGNTYIAWANGAISSTPAGSLATPLTGDTSNPHQIAIDGAGNVFVADTGGDRIAEIVPGGTTATTIVGGLNSPQGVAVDAVHNLYIADTGNQRVLMQPINNGLTTQLGSGFQTPIAVAVDANGNVYVADSALGEIVKIVAATGEQTTVASRIAPVSLAVDAAGDIDYLDSALNQVIEISVIGAPAPLVSGLTTPQALALDASGGLYVADGANTGISYYSRMASSQNFASISSTLGATLTNIGNATFSGSISQTDSNDFSLSPSASNGCNSLTSLALASGQNCGLTALFTPVGTGSLSETVTISGNSIAGNLGLTLSGYVEAPVAGTTTTLSGLTPPAPTYGQSVQIMATVSATSGSTTPTGTVSFVIDGGTPTVPQNLDATGAYTVTLPSLSAGPHSVSATYSPTGNFSASSTTTPFNFSVVPLPITAAPTMPVSFTYGQPVPTIRGTLNGVLSVDTANVAPVFTTTATSVSPVGGAYPIGVSLTGTAASNYAVTLDGSPTVSVQAAPVTLAVSNAGKAYGGANPSFTGTFSGVLSQDAANVSANFSTTATASSAAGPYPITATALTGTAAGNYTLSSATPGTLTVSPLAIAATATPVSVGFGQPIPQIAGGLTGVLATDAGNVLAVFTTTATAGSPVGSYPISVSLSGSAAANYSVTLTGSPTVTIQPGVVTIAVNNATRQYGAANPTFSGTLTGVASQDAANVSAVYSTTATATSSVNTYPITAKSLTGSAAANYSLGTVTAGTLTITQAGTATSLTASTASVGEGSSVTFTATVSSLTSGTPTGSVTFSSNGATLGTANLSSGVATYSTNALAVGVQSITASYVATTNFSTSTSAPVSETVTVPVTTGTVSSSTVTLQGGSGGSVNLNISATGGYTGTATYSCALLPADMTCSFSPATSTFTSSNTTAAVTLTISTNGGKSTTAMAEPGRIRRNGGLPLALAAGLWLPGLCVGLLGLGTRRAHWQRYFASILFVVAGLAGIAGLTGCGGSAGTGHTPPGTYNIQVEITAGTVQTIPLTVVVQ